MVEFYNSAKEFFATVGTFLDYFLDGIKAFLSIISHTVAFSTKLSNMLPMFLIPAFTVAFACLIVLAIIKR